MLIAYKKSWLDSFDYKSRMSKETWNKAVGMHVLLAFVPVLVFVLLDLENVGMIWSVFSAFSFVPVLSCLVRRLHDIGKSGWWLLLDLALAPVLVGWIMFVLQMRKDSSPENKWGAPMSEENGLSAGSFVDERLTEADVKSENKKLLLTILKIFGILILVSLIIELINYGSMMLAPLL